VTELISPLFGLGGGCFFGGALAAPVAKVFRL